MPSPPTLPPPLLQPFDMSSLLSSIASLPLQAVLPPLPGLLPLPHLSSYWPRRQFPARPRGLFPVCPGAGGNLSGETNCLVAASCEHLAQLGMPSRVTPPETECGRRHAQACARAGTRNTHPHGSAAICPLQLWATR